MNEIFLKALEKLSDPVAIIAIVLLFTVVLLVINQTRVLPRIHNILGKHTAFLEMLVYGKKDDD